MKEAFLNKKGVYVSIALSVLNVCFLMIALLGVHLEIQVMESVSFIAIIIEIVYGVYFIFKILYGRGTYNHIIPFLFLNWFIGCFSTNILIGVFENLPIWVYMVTFAFCLSNFLIYNDYQKKIVTPLAYFVNGISFLLILYFMLYLIPLMPLSFVGILAVGLGFYGLVPAIVCFWHVNMLFTTTHIKKRNMLPFAVGFLSGIVGIVIFVSLLIIENKKLNSYLVTKSFDITTDLPNYIKVSQHLEPNFCNEILLKKGIVYIHNDDFFEFRGLDGFGNKQYNERKRHNPIVNIAYVFLDELSLSADDRINILRSNFDKRLETEEQLWSGEDLVTKNIKEDVKIYANERLAYTEITMDVACDEDAWRDREAIYSFQLPEGSVATSLSLWVNGVERQGVLTTKEKAKAAYRQIVGVEARDPSLMQWKEGNRVVVRVFPIRHDLPRTFKCGFTTPLKVMDSKMVYSSLSIKGPNISNAETVSRIQIVGDNNTFETSKDFELVNNFYINESKGLEDWRAELPLNHKAFDNSFVWKDKIYHLKKIQKQRVSFVPERIVLDLNNNWEKNDVEKILTNLNHKYFVFLNNEWSEINKENYEVVFDQFKSLQYSLPPLYKLKDNSLLVTKCGAFSANFEELEASNYLKKIKAKTKQKNIKVISISNDINPFWQTIKEQKYVGFLQTDLNNCIDLIAKNQFEEFEEKENQVNIEVANVAIQENPLTDKSKSKGSNHIFRMYAFGKVLDEQVAIQSDSLANNQFVNLAKEANVVTPISSLIVLETDADYENNGIEKNVNTLGNASITNDGAVPEPYEWALIIVLVVTLLYYYNRQKTNSVA